MLPNRPGRFQYAFLHKALTLGVLAVTLAVALPCFYFGDKFHLTILTGVGGIAFVSGLFVAIFLVREVIYRMEEEGTLLFRKAVAHTVNGYVLKLYFVPIVGPLIERLTTSEAHKNPFIEDDGKK